MTVGPGVFKGLKCWGWGEGDSATATTAGLLLLNGPYQIARETVSELFAIQKDPKQVYSSFYKLIYSLQNILEWCQKHWLCTPKVLILCSEATPLIISLC